MGLIFLIIFSLLLTTVAPIRDKAHDSCSALFEDDEHESNDVSLRTRLHHESNAVILRTRLHHIHGPCSPVTSPKLPLTKILELDEARAKYLSNRQTKTNVSEHIIQNSGNFVPQSISAPLNPGQSIGVGNYVMKLGLGTPAKYLTVVMDTGSSFSWVQCAPCTINCHPQVDPTFDPSSSSTHRFLTCTTPECSSLKSATLNDPACSRRSNRCIYGASYGDGSFSVGYLSRDALSLGSAQALPAFVYGCGQDNEGLFGESAGLVGLARHKLSLFSQLAEKYGYSFSYCLPTAASTGSLSIGQYDPSPYKFTRMYTDSKDSTLYSLRMASITVNGKAIPVSTAVYQGSRTIIDSGTVITRLPSSIYTALQAAFVRAMAGYTRAPSYSILDACFVGGIRGKRVPSVRLVFEGGAELALGPQNTMIDLSNGNSCLAFARTDGVGIIANHQQQTFRVVYDVSNSRIGFAAGGCR